MNFAFCREELQVVTTVIKYTFPMPYIARYCFYLIVFSFSNIKSKFLISLLNMILHGYFNNTV